MTKNPRGSISISSVKGRLRLQFPRAWFDGTQKYHALNLPDTNDNRLHAATVVRDMEWDYLKGQFDRTLAKYFQVGQTTQDKTIAGLWDDFCRYKSKSLKPASVFYLVKTLGRHIEKCPYQSISQSLDVREWLLEQTTASMTKKIITALATAVNWGIKHQKVALKVNPFAGMSADIRVEKEDPKPNAFTPDERERVIAAFRENRYYRDYLPIVRFWLLTGCRPSEGIGLEWEQISDDFSSIRFDRSIIHLEGKIIRNKRSKTNRIRTFPISEELGTFLREHRARSVHKSSLVFPSKNNKPIDYDNFSHRAWAKIVEPVIGRSSTPYSCRDTFITDQIGKGQPIALVARWCDNSTEIIERTYLDPSALDRFKPL